MDYEIARFVLDQNNNKTAIFEYLVEMVEGYFISTAISYQSKTGSPKTKFKKMHCYLDTRIVINALGLHLPKDLTLSTNEFLSMLRVTGAEVFCFKHNLSEVKSIISAYRASLTNSTYQSGNTLEFFDEMRFTPADVDNYLTVLEKKIETLGIRIVDAPDHDLSYKEEAHIDYLGLQNELKARMKYNYRSIDKASDTDCKSVESIMLLRNGDKPTELEKAKYIFVSNSYNLEGIVNTFLGHDKEHTVPTVISEIELASWLWIRNYATHRDFPKDQLLLNAIMASEMPSSQFLEVFYDKIEKMCAIGQLTDDEAVSLRTDMFCRKEIYKVSYGDSDEISDESVMDIRERLKRKYIGEANSEIRSINSKLKDELDKRAKVKRRIFEEVHKTGELQYQQIYSVGIVIATVFFVFIALGIVALSCINLGLPEIDSIIKRIAGAVLCVLDVVGYIQLVLGTQGKINQCIRRIAKNSQNRAEDKKKRELLAVFDYDTDE